MRESMKGCFELLLIFSSFIIHNSSFSFTYPLAAGGKVYNKSLLIFDLQYWWRYNKIKA